MFLVYVFFNSSSLVIFNLSQLRNTVSSYQNTQVSKSAKLSNHNSFNVACEAQKRLSIDYSPIFISEIPTFEINVFLSLWFCCMLTTLSLLLFSDIKKCSHITGRTIYNENTRFLCGLWYIKGTCETLKSHFLIPKTLKWISPREDIAQKNTVHYRSVWIFSLKYRSSLLSFT